LQFGNTWFTGTKEISDQLPVFIKIFHAGDDPIRRWFFDDPGLINVIGFQMEVELRIEDVVPASHLLEIFDWSGMDLDTSVIACKTHDGNLSFYCHFKQFVNAVVWDSDGHTIGRILEGLNSGDLISAKQPKESVGVLEVS